MKKFYLIILTLFIYSYSFAEIKTPGSGMIENSKLEESYTKKLNKIKQNADKKISWKLRYSTSCRYRDWDRAKGGYYIWGVEDNIATR